MEIAIIADDMKKELMTEFCIAYCGILCKHSICATATTANYITEATGLKIEKMMPGARGGAEQIASRVAYNRRGTMKKAIPRSCVCAIFTTFRLPPTLQLPK